MTQTRKTSWAALALSLPLAFLAGCGETAETPAPTDVPTATTPSVTAPAPTPSPSAQPDTTTKTETPKTDAPKTDTPKTDEPKVDAPKVDAPKTDAPKTDTPKTDAPKTAAAKLTGDEIAEIKKLPAGEVDAALKQAVCPVSDENLGGMGAPIKVTAEGKTFYLCCKSCQKEVDANPKTVVAKLSK